MASPEHRDPEAHLEVSEVSAYLSGSLTEYARRHVEIHLADCGECTAEVAEVASIARVAPQRSRWVWIGLSAAVAASILFAIFPGVRRTASHTPEFREPGITLAAPPVPTSPVGLTHRPITFHWGLVPRADRYRVTLFAADGSALWEAEQAGTDAVLPDSVSLMPGRAYYWQVEARTQVGRWVASPLTEFRVGRSAP